jgi:Ca-activated chloride channel family protein
MIYRNILIFIGILVLFQQMSYGELSRKKINEGIKAYEKDQFDQSLQHFQDALLDDPENPVGHFNVGESLYKKKNYQEALNSYEKALSTQELPLRQKTYYNMGNTFYQLNKYQEAIESYIKALDLDPTDEDAKHNLELVRAKLKEMAQKQPQQNQPQQQQQQGAQQQQQNQSGEDQQDQKQEQQDQQKKEEQDSQEQQQKAQQVEKQKELSKEEAERILQALKSQEKENQKLRREKTVSQRGRVEKDW